MVNLYYYFYCMAFLCVMFAAGIFFINICICMVQVLRTGVASEKPDVSVDKYGKVLGLVFTVLAIILVILSMLTAFIVIGEQPGKWVLVKGYIFSLLSIYVQLYMEKIFVGVWKLAGLLLMLFEGKHKNTREVGKQ